MIQNFKLLKTVIPFDNTFDDEYYTGLKSCLIIYTLTLTINQVDPVFRRISFSILDVW